MLHSTYCKNQEITNRHSFHMFDWVIFFWRKKSTKIQRLKIIYCNIFQICNFWKLVFIAYNPSQDSKNWHWWLVDFFWRKKANQSSILIVSNLVFYQCHIIRLLNKHLPCDVLCNHKIWMFWLSKFLAHSSNMDWGRKWPSQPRVNYNVPSNN